MDKFKLFIIDDDGSVEAILQALFSGESGYFEIITSNDVDETLEKIVTENPDLCLVCDKDGRGNTEIILREIKVAGLKNSVITLVDPEHAAVDADLMALGSKGVILRDASLEVVLRYAANNIADLKKIEEQHRDEKNEMLLQLLDLRDARERAEEQSSNLVELAEDLSIAREELEKLNNEKNKFFSIIAHDLRSPFNVILGYTGMLADGAETLTPAQVKEFAGGANEASLAVFKLLENLLEWARLQMERTVSSPMNVKLGGIVDKTVELLSSVANDKNIRLESSLTDDIAYIDANMIDAVIRNLVNNAIKFTEIGGSIAITSQDLGDRLEVRVTDTGVGMEPDKVDNIFSLADSNSAAGTKGEQGTGLGLLLCKELVERNGGEIYVTSEPGKGSTFAFAVPKNAPED
ncbi:MAG: HAMP domain-containing sensor histidine kinase [Rhodospirillales bacterium]